MEIVAGLTDKLNEGWWWVRASMGDALTEIGWWFIRGGMRLSTGISLAEWIKEGRK